MKKIESLSFPIVIVWLLHSTVPCIGQDESLGSPMKRAEQEALYNTLQDFVGKWWNGSDLYPDPCGWTPIQGVSCDLYDGFWYVTDLSIGPVHDNSLTCGEDVDFSPHLFALRHLKSLSFINCFVTPRRRAVSIPTGNWAGTLTSIEFRSNSGLTGAVPDVFGGLRNLQSLVITENGLMGQLPESIGNLVELRRLNVAGNSFTGRVPGSIGGLNRLLILDMSGNSLSGTLPATLGRLTALLKLDLSCNQLEGEIPIEIRNLKNLTLLDLSDNRLSGGLGDSIEELSSLQELVLSNNPIGGNIMGIGWQKLRCITALELSNMSLTGGIPESLTHLKSLRYLGLNDNKLTGDIPSEIAALPNVSAIYLHGNNLTGELNFSELFYGRMGRRFGVWGNPNLCYQVELESASNAPFGVKPCPHQLIKYLDSNRNWTHHPSSSMASFGFKMFGVSGLVLVVEAFLVLAWQHF
ncbi:piriformospora indica-insensitive protein 2-like [Salvia miltiorrhiza]|uniref:piriformospora indica-insensitive protein 2-like n=1 Tax=Salvia miltiorrhiza TaxID=226208 RepID=UPI0025AC0FE7|nr:piriformospora indica-insensitive protein 2-like [Salvia miltiorrhiza]XP_057765675.1 piriformospora indica-insensitive protein 2-like [Salvia miltiorrhiza]